MNQEQGKESEQGFKASCAGSKVASRMLHSPQCGARLWRGWKTSVVTRRKAWGNKKKTEPVVYPEPARNQGREGMDEKLVLVSTLH